MEDVIKQLIKLNIQLEGVLRVMLDRQTSEAVEQAKEIVAQINNLADALPKVDVGADTPVEIKELEAEGAESAPLEEPGKFDVPVDSPVIVYNDADAEEVALHAAKPADIRRNLTLNDKFLFKRELFGDSEAELNDTLDLIVTMHSVEEAREYLFEDLQWQADDPVVKDFMAVVADYFSQR